MATKLEGVGEALVACPIVQKLFCGFPKGDKECVCKELRMDFQEWESCPYELSYRFGIDSVTGKKVGD